MRSTLVFDLVFFLVAFSVSDAFTWPKFGRCPKVAVEQQFDVDSYLGKWYDQGGYNTDMVTGDVRCVSADYQPTAKYNAISVRNRAISQSTNKPVWMNATASLTDPSKKEGKLSVTFNLFWIFPIKGDYWVLGTDYDYYSVVYSCHNFLLFFHYETIWALSRYQTFDSEAIKDDFYYMAKKQLWKNNITASITPSNQTYCDI